MSAGDRALRAARKDIPKSLQRNELSSAADALLAVPEPLRGEFSALPESLRVKVAAMHAQRAWVPLHAFAARAEKHPPLVADDATWWALMIASAQQRDLARARRIWQRLRPSAASSRVASAVDAWLAGDESPESLDALRAALPAEDPRLGVQAVTPKAAIEAPRSIGDVRDAVLRAFATLPFGSVASMLPGWAARLSSEGVVALWSLAVPLALREMLRRLAGVAAGSADEPLRLAIKGIEAANGPSMAPHRALLARYAMAALQGQLPGASGRLAISTLRIPLGDPELRERVLAALDGVDLSGLSDGDAREACVELLRLAPRGAVLCAVISRLARGEAAPEVIAATSQVLRDDVDGVIRWLAKVSAPKRSFVLGRILQVKPTALWAPIAEARWERADDHERERIFGMITPLLRSAGKRMAFVFGPEHEALARILGGARARVTELFQELYEDLEDSLVDDLDCEEIDALIEEFAPPIPTPALERAWMAAAFKAHSDYHDAQQKPLSAGGDEVLRRWVDRGATFDPRLLSIALREAKGDAALTLARDFARRRKGMTSWTQATLCADAERKKSVADKVFAEGLALYGGDLAALRATYDARSFFELSVRHRRRFAQAVVDAARSQGGGGNAQQALMLRWAHAQVNRTKASAEKRKATLAKKRTTQKVKP